MVVVVPNKDARSGVDDAVEVGFAALAWVWSADSMDWRIVSEAVSAVGVEEPSGLPNRRLASWNCTASSLNCTMSVGEALWSADWTLGEDKAVESVGESALRDCSRFETTELVVLTKILSALWVSNVRLFLP